MASVAPTPMLPEIFTHSAVGPDGSIVDVILSGGGEDAAPDARPPSTKAFVPSTNQFVPDDDDEDDDDVDTDIYTPKAYTVVDGVLTAKAWQEAAHPRDHGKFAAKPGGRAKTPHPTDHVDPHRRIDEQTDADTQLALFRNHYRQRGDRLHRHYAKVALSKLRAAIASGRRLQTRLDWSKFKMQARQSMGDSKVSPEASTRDAKGADGVTLKATEYHGPTPPGEGWTLSREGPKGGKVWIKNPRQHVKNRNRAINERDYEELVYQVGKKIRSRIPVPEAEMAALNEDDRALFEKMKAEYPTEPKKPKPEPALKVIDTGVNGIELVDGKFSSLDKPDGFLYHVTTKGNAESILKGGFSTNRPQAMDAGFYREYSKGKIFFAERNGVSYWQNIIENHLQAQTDETVEPLVVLRIPRNSVKNIRKDKLGTTDSGAGAYYSETTKSIAGLTRKATEIESPTAPGPGYVQSRTGPRGGKYWIPNPREHVNGKAQAARQRAQQPLGSKGNPYRCGSNIKLAARLLAQGKHVELNQPDEVATLTHELQKGKDLRERPIFVTRDGFYILDGHHHWAALVVLGADKGHDYKIPVYELDMDIGFAISEANAFAKQMGIKPKSVGTPATKKAAADCGCDELAGDDGGAITEKALRRAKVSPGPGWVLDHTGKRGGRYWRPGTESLPSHYTHGQHGGVRVGVRPQVADVINHISAILSRGDVTAKHVQTLGKMLTRMSVREIGALKKQMRVKASGVKEDLVKKVAARVLKYDRDVVHGRAMPPAPRHQPPATNHPSPATNLPPPKGAPKLFDLIRQRGGIDLQSAKELGLDADSLKKAMPGIFADAGGRAGRVPLDQMAKDLASEGHFDTPEKEAGDTRLGKQVRVERMLDALESGAVSMRDTLHEQWELERTYYDKDLKHARAIAEREGIPVNELEQRIDDAEKEGRAHGEAEGRARSPDEIYRDVVQERKPPEPGFTGTDALGRDWIDGELVPADVKEAQPATGGEQPTVSHTPEELEALMERTRGKVVGPAQSSQMTPEDYAALQPQTDKTPEQRAAKKELDDAEAEMNRMFPSGKRPKFPERQKVHDAIQARINAARGKLYAAQPPSVADASATTNSQAEYDRLIAQRVEANHAVNNSTGPEADDAKQKLAAIDKQLIAFPPGGPAAAERAKHKPGRLPRGFKKQEVHHGSQYAIDRFGRKISHLRALEERAKQSPNETVVRNTPAESAALVAAGELPSANAQKPVSAETSVHARGSNQWLRDIAKKPTPEPATPATVELRDDDMQAVNDASKVIDAVARSKAGRAVGFNGPTALRRVRESMESWKQDPSERNAADVRFAVDRATRELDEIDARLKKVAAKNIPATDKQGNTLNPEEAGRNYRAAAMPILERIRREVGEGQRPAPLVGNAPAPVVGAPNEPETGTAPAQSSDLWGPDPASLGLSIDKANPFAITRDGKRVASYRAPVKPEQLNAMATRINAWEAIQAGKPVPPEVLSRFPDLAKRAAPKPKADPNKIDWGLVKNNAHALRDAIAQGKRFGFTRADKDKAETILSRRVGAEMPYDVLRGNIANHPHYVSDRDIVDVGTRLFPDDDAQGRDTFVEDMRALLRDATGATKKGWVGFLLAMKGLVRHS